MSDMIERVARALCKNQNERQFWQDFEPMARAAIEAMRVPAKGMIPEGWLAAHRIVTDDRCNHEMIRSAWRAMIDAALEPDDIKTGNR